ncbi:alpha-L-fucosidase [Sunxiuqinia elliptica]|uniref:alpha-L-fucosidase n=2 Tax=Sunxiuqinia elliptica TaxID=655355 RepID=A0A4R6GLR0_9BACT|nr:alpha-L-fucosidase [Sunxiuqinia elliptica]TDO67818.1 alpha-L-fucosidase [Sunxiuqinia elliptica]
MLVVLFGCGTTSSEQTSSYEDSWESLAKHNEEPDWFKNAKFGIYFHWGVYSVPAFKTEWYPRHMHFEHGWSDGLVYKHHLETYGHPSEFGYHDFVPMFKAEHFDASQWADLFEKAGARFAGPVAEHHDGFSMWDSEVTPWNAMDKGPHQDITGELGKEIKARGMKFITTFHHARNLQRYWGKEGEKNFENSHYPLIEGMPQSKHDPELDYLYGNIPEEKWLEEVWFGKLKEVIDKYQPDIIWFDSWLDQIPESYRQKFCAYYLNEAQKNDKEVVIVRKQDDLPLTVSVDDLEKSRKNKMGEKVWMTDETLSTGSWCYTEDLVLKPAADVLHVLIDIVSKNGVLLLNISPKSDGTIPDGQQQILLSMGDWLKKYGEAIYDTRPWISYGEGPTVQPEGHFNNHQDFLNVKYSAKDIRYTIKNDVVYATTLGSPNAEESLLMKAFAETNLKIKNVSVLGSEQDIVWEMTTEGLQIERGFPVVDDMAQVFKIQF